MIKDIYGQLIFSEQDIFHYLMKTNSTEIKSMLTDFNLVIHQDLELTQCNEFVAYPGFANLAVHEFDTISQSSWFMPSDYQEFNIDEWLLSKCDTDEKKDRVNDELIMFNERNLINLLKYLKFLVDTCRTNNIVWGVGRGSSVSSYVLYLIGIHKIDSIKYNLNINEFLR